MSIDKIKTGDDLTQSLDIVSNNISKLKELFPEVLTEGKIDFKVLQDILGNEIEEEEEFYRFTWAGKSQSRREAHKPSTGTLRPCKEESVDWDTTQNIYIEGDNLEVLKLLQKSYSNKVKMIYIDPPYNTGKDFVYKDNYKDNLKNYQQVTGQIDNEGNRLSTNSESDGRYHSNWLNMMYPRLRLARNLLKEDGVIFMSIDDNEVDNLKKVCDEIFGELNFIESFVWQKAFAPKNDAKYFSTSHEYIICYSKNIESFKRILLPRSDENNSSYSNPDNDNRGDWTSTSMLATTYSENYVFEILSPNGKSHVPPTGRCWRYSKEKILELINDNRIWFGANGENVPRTKRFLTEVQQGIVPQSLLLFKDVGSGQDGTNGLKKIFGNKQYFDFPKPVSLISHLLKISTTTDDIILDFFSGSSTTGQSVMEMNSQEFGKRKFILIQIPESTDTLSDAFKDGLKTITDIGKERLRRVRKKMFEENPLLIDNLDTGFKVFKLDSSNIKGWDGQPENLEKSLFESQDNIKSERTEEDVLFEILLKYGLDLTLPIEEKDIEGKKVFNVGFGALFICLGNDLTSKIAEGIGQWKETLKPETCRVIFKDGGFTDVEKTNSVQTLKRFGIQEIKSI